ncbi:hypothetical protein [Candidatus Puniceispirillum sp.]|uniref:hypothetical protein n=1 Tax=Candidatus Puniceispirillum sp. TaxID=2026719 RepID=UPI003F6985C8
MKTGHEDRMTPRGGACQDGLRAMMMRMVAGIMLGDHVGGSCWRIMRGRRACDRAGKVGA